jgi:hypothetical protein
MCRNYGAYDDALVWGCLSIIIHLKQQQKRIPNVRLFFFLMEEIFCPLSPSAKARRQNIRESRRGRQLPPSLALAEPKVVGGKRERLVCSPLLLPVLCLLSSTPLLIDCHRKKRLQVFRISIHNMDNQQAWIYNAVIFYG